MQEEARVRRRLGLPPVGLEPVDATFAVVLAPLPRARVAVVVHEDGLAVDLAHVEVRRDRAGRRLLVNAVRPAGRALAVVIAEPPPARRRVVLEHDGLPAVLEEERVRRRVRLPLVDRVPRHAALPVVLAENSAAVAVVVLQEDRVAVDLARSEVRRAVFGPLVRFVRPFARAVM